MSSAADTPAPAVSGSAWDRLSDAVSRLEQRPCLKEGLDHARHVSRQGAPYVVLGDVQGGNYLRLGEDEWALLPLIDGQRTLKEIVIEDYQRTGQVSFGRVAGLVSNLRNSGLLTTPPRDVYADLAAKLRPRTFSRARNWLLHSLVSVELGGPHFDGFFGWVYHHGGSVFFTRAAAIAGLILGICGPVFLTLELARHRYPLFQARDSFFLGLVLFLVLEVVTLVIHELGHALAVKHAGRFAPRAGVMLYYGFPAAFVDSSDIWMAGRRQRLVASFAGSWTGLALGGIAAIAGYLVPEGGLGAFLHAWSFVLVFNTLLNLNPLLELDGYYVLIDLIDRPMLRARSFAFLRERALRRALHRERLRDDEPLLLAFGVASIVGSAAVLGLAFFVWRARTWPAVVEVWDSGNPALRGVLLALAVLIALVLAAWIHAAALALHRIGRAGIREVSRAGDRRRYQAAVDALRTVPLLASSATGRLQDLAAQARWLECSAGSDVVTQGEAGDEFFVIERGEFQVSASGEQVAFLGPGDYFGERALLDEAPRAATVTSLEPGRLLVLDRPAFDRALRHDLQTRQTVEAAAAYRDLVAAMPLFSELTPVELDLVLAQMARRPAAANEVIVREGEPGHEFFVVLGGRLEVSRQGAPLAVLGRGDVFGETALIADVPRTATVTAVAAAELLVMDRDRFETLLLSYLERAGDLQRLSSVRLESQRRLDEALAS